ncbi:hypothetical protein ACIRBX_29895 [Kitasatospora sp. NPDC096147]|uniref:hypothetical protein n=1 Tax=Kitasatospora sp. NPDC096147 TaxID=3364093 RepID=UPI00380E41A2
MLSRSFRDFEPIAVDDCSSDGSGELPDRAEGVRTGLLGGGHHLAHQAVRAATRVRRPLPERWSTGRWPGFTPAPVSRTGVDAL